MITFFSLLNIATISDGQYLPENPDDDHNPTVICIEFIDFSGAGDADGPTYNGGDAGTSWGGGYTPLPE